MLRQQIKADMTAIEEADEFKAKLHELAMTVIKEDDEFKARLKEMLNKTRSKFVKDVTTMP